jgi:siroheme synthase
MANYPKDTPVGIIQNAGCPNQRMVVGSLDTIADIAEEYKVKAPSTIVVGDVVNVLLEPDSIIDDSEIHELDGTKTTSSSSSSSLHGLLSNMTMTTST